MRRLRVAAFTPGPPLTGGGAIYAGQLLPALGELFDVTAVAPRAVAWSGPTAPVEQFDPATFDVLVHLLGNNPEHLFAYHSAIRWGGVIGLHDFSLFHLLWRESQRDALAELDELVGPVSAAKVGARWRRRVHLAEQYLVPLLQRPLRGARAVVVHHRHGEFLVNAQAPGVPVYVAPMHAAMVPPDVPERAVARRALGVAQDAFTVGIFGHVSEHKRVPQALRALSLAEDELRHRDVPLTVVIVGREPWKGWASRLLGGAGLRDARLVSDSDDAAFFAWMSAVDVVLNLRFPSAGEASLTLAQAMLLGKPAVVSDYAQYTEEPAALRVPPGAHEIVGVADALIHLAMDPQLSRELAARARAAAERHRVERTAEGYSLAIEHATRARTAH